LKDRSVNIVTGITVVLALLCMGVGAWLTMAGFVLATLRASEGGARGALKIRTGIAASCIGLLMFGAGSIGVARLLA
jgi:hypothetical protein